MKSVEIFGPFGERAVRACIESQLATAQVPTFYGPPMVVNKTIAVE